jgi:hypothetical protein
MRHSEHAFQPNEKWIHHHPTEKHQRKNEVQSQRNCHYLDFHREIHALAFFVSSLLPHLNFGFSRGLAALVHHHLVQHPLMNLAFVNSNMDKASCCLLQSHQPP